MFPAVLLRLRREAGFKSAYQFYHDNGGRRHFPFTYVHYLRIERGESLPRPEWVPLFITSLRLSPGAQGCRAFLIAFLEALLGTQRACDAVLSPLLTPAKAANGPGDASRQALRWIKSEHTVHMTPEQFRVVAADEATYWCSEVLCSDSSSWTAAQLAAKLALPAPALQRGLERLVKARLAKRTSDQRFRSRWEGKIFTFPGRLEGMRGLLRKVQGYWERAIARHGQDIIARVELVRADKGAVRDFGAALAEAVEGANLRSTREPGPATGFFLVEVRVRRVRPF